jgi:hypothetical protein
MVDILTGEVEDREPTPEERGVAPYGRERQRGAEPGGIGNAHVVGNLACPCNFSSWGRWMVCGELLREAPPRFSDSTEPSARGNPLHGQCRANHGPPHSRPRARGRLAAPSGSEDEGYGCQRTYTARTRWLLSLAQAPLRCFLSSLGFDPVTAGDNLIGLSNALTAVCRPLHLDKIEVALKLPELDPIRGTMGRWI